MAMNTIADVCQDLALSIGNCLDMAEQKATAISSPRYLSVADEWVELISPSPPMRFMVF
jgi:hypothetical protein